MVHSFLIEPDTYTAFSDEAELIDKCKEWGLLSDKAAKIKTFYYKGHGLNEACSIIGYVDHITAVIELANHQKHCIHPSYLKEMQAASYGVKAGDAAEAPDDKGNETVSSKAADAEAEHEAKMKLPPLQRRRKRSQPTIRTTNCRLRLKRPLKPAVKS